MAEYKNEKMEARCVIPDELTVREQLGFYSKASSILGEPGFEGYFYGFRNIVSEWECAQFPDLEDINLGESNDPDLTSLVIWAAGVGLQHMNKLDRVEKN